MEKQLDFDTVKQATVEKWQRVLELLREAQDASHIPCEFCMLARVKKYECGDCPVDNLCGGDLHASLIGDLCSTIESTTKLCDEIIAIKKAKK